MTAGQPPRLYTREEGWQLLRIWGMGIASQDLDGDGRPEVFLTNQADNKLQTLVDGAHGPGLHDIGRKSGATAHQPVRGRRHRNSTAWHAEFEDVNNDGFMDLFVAKGNVEAMPDFAAKDPSNLLIGQPDHDLRRGRRGRRHRRLRPGPRGGRGRPQPGRPARHRRGQAPRERPTLAQRRRGRGRRPPAPMGHWAAIRLQQPAPNRDAIGAWIRVKVGDRIIDRELTVGGGHAGGQLGWTHFGLGPAQTARGPRPVAGRRGRSLDVPAGRRLRDHRARRRRGATMDAGRRVSDRPTGTRQSGVDRWIARGWRPSRCPTSACPTAMPSMPAATYAPASKRLRERAERRGYDRLVVYADREHSANLSYLTGFDPRFEEAILVVGRRRSSGHPGRQRVLRHGRRRAAADAPRPAPGPQPAGPAA